MKHTAHGMPVQEGASVQEGVASAVHCGMNVLEHALTTRSAVLHLHPAIDGVGTWRVARVASTLPLPHWRRPLNPSPRWRLSGIARPPSDERRSNAVPRASVRVSKSCFLNGDLVLLVALRRGVAALTSLDASCRIRFPFAPMVALADLPRYRVQRFVGRPRNARLRRPQRARLTHRRTVRRGQRVRKSRSPPTRGSTSSNDPPHELHGDRGVVGGRW